MWLAIFDKHGLGGLDGGVIRNSALGVRVKLLFGGVLFH